MFGSRTLRSLLFICNCKRRIWDWAVAGVRSGTGSNNYVRSLLDIPYQLDVLSIIGIGYKDQVRKPFDESHLQWEKIHIGKFSLPEENKEAEE